MPANAVVDSTSTVDLTATRYLPRINGETGPMWEMQKLVLAAGDQPSYAQILVPLKDLDDVAPAVAGIANSPVEGFKTGAAVEVDMITSDGTSALIFTGVVMDVDESFGAATDMAQVVAVDLRYLLEGLVVMGSFWMSGESGYAYREAWHAHVNPGGAPNCIWRTVGSEKIPVFCNPWHGLGVGDSAMQDSDESESAACYWTARTFARYLRFITTATAQTKAGFSFYPALPDTITWPAGFANIMDEEDGGYDRKLPDASWNGWQITKALSKLARSSGPFELFMDSQSGTNTIKIIRTAFGGDLVGIGLDRPTTGKAQTVFDGDNLVLEGNIRRSGRNTYTRFVVSGGLIFIENRVNTNDANDGTEGLVKGWTTTDQEIVRKYIETTYASNGNDLPAAVKDANRKFPAFGCAYHLAYDYDFTAGTTYAGGAGPAQVGRPILPHLLTSYLQGDLNATGVDAVNSEDAKKFRRPVLWEYAFASGSPTWALAAYNTGLSIDADGTLWLPGLREAGFTYGATQVAGVVTLTIRNLRATLAIPHDRSLVDAAKITADPSDMDVVPGVFQDDVQYIEDGLARTHYTHKSEFNLHERKTSWPVPESVTGATAAADGVIEDDSDEITPQVNKHGQNYGRLERAGRLKLSRYTPALQPGFAISHLETSAGSVNIFGVIQLVTITSSENKQEVWIDFGNVVGPVLGPET